MNWGPSGDHCQVGPHLARLVDRAGIGALEGDRLGCPRGLRRHESVARLRHAGHAAVARPLPEQCRQSAWVFLSSSSSDAPPAAPTSLRSVVNFRPRPRHAGHGVPPLADSPGPHLPELAPGSYKKEGGRKEEEERRGRGGEGGERGEGRKERGEERGRGGGRRRGKEGGEGGGGGEGERGGRRAGGPRRPRARRRGRARKNPAPPNPSTPPSATPRDARDHPPPPPPSLPPPPSPPLLPFFFLQNNHILCHAPMLAKRRVASLDAFQTSRFALSHVVSSPCNWRYAETRRHPESS